MLEDVRVGLSLPQKELSPTYFYDSRGSQLFEEITRLPEYYLTRTERSLLQSNAHAIVEKTRPATLAELGAGSAEKSRIIISEMIAQGTGDAYAPIDVSVSSLDETAALLRREYPRLRVVPIAADMRADLRLPRSLPHPILFAFLGSTIGNFTPTAAERLLAGIRSQLPSSDRLLLGVDLIKDESILNAAYNDTRNVTAEFNSNVLHVLNRELDADFDPAAFAHRALYHAPLRRVEMHLVSLRDQEVKVPAAGVFSLTEGETIRTEISCKYDRTMVEDMLSAAGFELSDWLTDDREWFALAVGTPA